MHLHEGLIFQTHHVNSHKIGLFWVTGFLKYAALYCQIIQEEMQIYIAQFLSGSTEMQIR